MLNDAANLQFGRCRTLHGQGPARSSPVRVTRCRQVAQMMFGIKKHWITYWGPPYNLAQDSSRIALANARGSENGNHNHPFSRAIRAASVRFDAPSLLIASDR